MKNPIFEKAGNALVIVVGKSTPVDGDWDALLDAMAKRDFRVKVCSSAGGSPTSAQRMRMRKALRDVSEPLALLTDDLGARLVLTAVGLFFKGLSAFGYLKVDEAMSYLEVPASERPEVLQTLDRLRKQMDDQGL